MQPLDHGCAAQRLLATRHRLGVAAAAVVRAIRLGRALQLRDLEAHQLVESGKLATVGVAEPLKRGAPILLQRA